MRRRVNYTLPRRCVVYTTIAVGVVFVLQVPGVWLRLSLWAWLVAWLIAVIAIVWNAVAAAKREVTNDAG